MNEPTPTPSDPLGVAVVRAVAVLLDQAASAGIRAQQDTGDHGLAMLGAQALALCHETVALLSLDGPALVRTWGEVIDAAEPWDGLPPGISPPGQVRGRSVDIMDQLAQGATSLHRRDRLAVPGTGYDERLLIVSEAFARAAHLVGKYPPASPNSRLNLSPLEW